MGTGIQLYTDAEMADGRGLGWRLEVKWSGQDWTIESGITINHSGGQDAVLDEPAYTTTRLDDCIEEMTRMAATIIDAKSGIQFGDFATK